MLLKVDDYFFFSKPVSVIKLDDDIIPNVHKQKTQPRRAVYTIFFFSFLTTIPRRWWIEISRAGGERRHILLELSDDGHIDGRRRGRPERREVQSARGRRVTQTTSTITESCRTGHTQQPIGGERAAGSRGVRGCRLVWGEQEGGGCYRRGGRAVVSDGGGRETVRRRGGGRPPSGGEVLVCGGHL